MDKSERTGKALDLTLYLVTGRYDFHDDQFLAVIEEACQNGVTLIQLREKTLLTGAFYELAFKVKAITDRYDVPLIMIVLTFVWQSTQQECTSEMMRCRWILFVRSLVQKKF